MFYLRLPITLVMNATAHTLRRARKQAGYTQTQAAKLAGFSTRQIRRHETSGTHDLRVIFVYSSLYKAHPAKLIFHPDQHDAVIRELTPPAIAAYLYKLACHNK